MCFAIHTTNSDFLPLNSIKCLVFVKETNCVYREVGTLYNHLHKIHTCSVSLTAEAWVRSLVSPVKFMANWHCDMFFISQYFSFPLSVSPYQCSILIFMLKLLLAEGQAGGAWELVNKAAL